MGGNAFAPTGFDALSRQVCGWSRVVDVTAPGTVRLAPADTGGQVYRLWIAPYRESEDLLLEFRRQAGVDQGLPGAGLLIWHVDLSADQSTFLRLLQADGRDDLSDTSGFGAADAGDPYPGATGNTAFTPTSTPASHSRRGLPTGIRVEQIAHDPATGTMLAAVTPANGLRGITLADDETYPGHAWNWSPTAGQAQGERAAVRFTTPSAGRLVAVKLKYWGPPLPPAGLGFDVAVHDDVLPGQALPATPLRRVQGNLAALTAQDFWYTISVNPPLDVRAGQTVVVDLGWETPQPGGPQGGGPGQGRLRGPRRPQDRDLHHGGAAGRWRRTRSAPSVECRQSRRDPVCRKARTAQRTNLSRDLALAVVMLSAVALVVGVSLVRRGDDTGPLPGGPRADGPRSRLLLEATGTVRQVDTAAGVVHVASDLLGICGAAVTVVPHTVILVGGRRGTVAELAPGDTVRVAYEVRDLKRVARVIEALAPGPAEPRSPRW